MMIPKITCVITFIFICLLTSSQNLVLNSSFEEIDRSKSFMRDSRYNVFTNIIDYVYHWTYVYDKSSPDLLSPYCENKHKKAPENIFGYQQSNWGHNYMGIACNKKLCEYIQGKLNSPLIKGEIYSIGFHISLADSNSYQYVDKIGALLSAKKITKRGQGLLSLTPQIVNHGQDLSNQKDWILINGLYKAEGGEQYIIIGSFSENEITFYDRVKKLKVGNRSGQAYYYVDNVFVKEYSINESEDNQTAGLIRLGNVNFEIGKSDLNKHALFQLTNIINYLKDNSGLKLKVIGYTDNTGGEELNQRLSLERAQVVVEYLIKNGIDNSRLFPFGFGCENPITANQTQNDKKVNRRVEFIVIN
ncbi:MAG: OmpA family protein [Carboxylicivirga sp.]|nr:OmpA family protein [Carboxylicivirga sp.]